MVLGQVVVCCQCCITLVYKEYLLHFPILESFLPMYISTKARNLVAWEKHSSVLSVSLRELQSLLLVTSPNARHVNTFEIKGTG